MNFESRNSILPEGIIGRGGEGGTTRGTSFDVLRRQSLRQERERARERERRCSDSKMALTRARAGVVPTRMTKGLKSKSGRAGAHGCGQSANPGRRTLLSLVENLRLAPSSRATRGATFAATANGNGNGSDGSYDYDLFTIGAGSGGVRGSRFAASYGAKVAVAELPFATKATLTTGGVGGTCVLRGCVPKKLLVYGSEFAKEFVDCNGYGWDEFDKPAHRWEKLIESKNNEIQRLTGIYKRILDNNSVELVEGRGKLLDAHTVDVDGKVFTAKNIMIATGGLPFVPNIPGKDLVITSDDALDLPTMPKKVAIVGAGFIAVEFAGIFNSFGADVSLFFRGDKILRGFDDEVRDFLTEQMEEKGVKVTPKTVPVEVLQGEDGKKGVRTSEGGEIQWFDEVMYATGRVPNVEELGLENAGVETTAGGVIKVDDYSRTNVSNIFAVGDVTDRINLTPVALMEGMAVAKTLFDNDPTKPDHEYVASAVFSQPPIGTVGYTETDALEKFGSLKVFTSSFRPLKNTISGSTERSFMKIVVDSETDRVVGVHMCGDDAAEIMQGIAIAVKMGATKADFDATVGIHPTAAEEFVTMRSVTREVAKELTTA